jgi:hypothetical protein
VAAATAAADLKTENSRLKAANDTLKSTISELKSKLEASQTDNYHIKKDLENICHENDTKTTEIRRMKERMDNLSNERDSVIKKFNDQKASKEKQMESYQSIIKSILSVFKMHQKYMNTLERGVLSSYENLLMAVEYKFDYLEEAVREIPKIELEQKSKKLLSTQSMSIVESINEYISQVNFEEVSKIFSKVIKEIRGRKYLDEREAAIFFNDMAPSSLNQSFHSSIPASLKQVNSSTITVQLQPTVEFEQKIKLIIDILKDLKQNLEKESTTEALKSEKLSTIIPGMKDLHTSLQSVMDGLHKIHTSTVTSSPDLSYAGSNSIKDALEGKLS